MASDNEGFPMPFLGVLDGFFPDLYLPDFAVIAGSLSGEHVLLVVRRRASRDVGAADVADRSFDVLVNGNRFGPCGFVNDPNLFSILDPSFFEGCLAARKWRAPSRGLIAYRLLPRCSKCPFRCSEG